MADVNRYLVGRKAARQREGADHVSLYDLEAHVSQDLEKLRTFYGENVSSD